MNENKTYPIERVLMDADHMAKVATELLAGCASLAIASNAVNDEETAENLAALEQAEGILGEQAHAMRLAMHEYRKRAQRYRDSLAESATAELAAKAKPVEVHGLGTPNVDVLVHDGKVVHYDNGPNLAEALARLASRVAKVRNLPAPTITAQPPAVAGAVPDAEILAHFYGGKDQDAMNYSNLRDVVYQFTQSELLCAARAMLAATPQATAEDSSVVQADAPAPATEYSWSNNGEEYHGRFSSVAEAVCDYLDSEGDGAGEVVHVGEVKPHEPGNPIWLADNVLETLGEQAHGDVGEYVGDWPELPPEKREQLGKMIQDFVWTHDAPSFFSIGKSELVEVAAYRDDAAGQKGGEA